MNMLPVDMAPVFVVLMVLLQVEETIVARMSEIPALHSKERLVVAFLYPSGTQVDFEEHSETSAIHFTYTNSP
jgi:hypothetical protein